MHTPPIWNDSDYNDVIFLTAPLWNNTNKDELQLRVFDTSPNSVELRWQPPQDHSIIRYYVSTEIYICHNSSCSCYVVIF